jgi:D-alanine-D-alanine ligase
VSVITGLQAFNAVDKTKYDVIPIYITKENAMYTGAAIGDIAEYSDIRGLLGKSKRITIMEQSLYEITPKKVDVRKPLTRLDVALPCVHGTNVEDGVLQGFFEMLGLTYAGCDVLSSAVGMDKTVQKAVLKQAGLPVLDYTAFSAKEFAADKEALLERIAQKIAGGNSAPCIIKPVNLGSSIGIKIAHNKEELSDAIENAFLFSDRVMAERAVTNLKEVNCAVLGDRDNAEASECEEPVSTGGILDFNDKYAGGKGGSKSEGGGKNHSGMASLKRKIPADITQSQREEIRSMAVSAFKELGCSGVARIDFLIDTDSGKILFNEINTIPGSLSFYLFEPLKISYSELLDKLIALALKRQREKSNLNFSFESNILAGFRKGLGTKE